MLEHVWLHVQRAKVSINLQPEPHPFATAMADFLLESGRRANRASLVQAMMTGTNAKYEADMKTMNELVDESACTSCVDGSSGFIVY